ncbi:MAG: thermonuclease family protein [Patescibacteria group bacterium]
MGIDAPELYERWGTVAYETNRDLVEGKLVRIEEDHPDRDFYGRTLAHVWIDDMLVCERLVDDGLATVLIIKGEAKPKYLSRLEAAEARAKGATRGLWTPRP